MPAGEGVEFLYILGMTLPINDLCISDGDREILTIESMKSIIVSCCYKPPDGNWKNHCDHMQGILTNATMENKNFLCYRRF